MPGPILGFGVFLKEWIAKINLYLLFSGNLC